jgi:hypothetical protein
MDLQRLHKKSICETQEGLGERWSRRKKGRGRRFAEEDWRTSTCGGGGGGGAHSFFFFSAALDIEPVRGEAGD